jgi:GNAT superfamily N-acetyltransferase
MVDPDEGAVYVIEADDGAAAGTIAYWTRTWREDVVWETGWLVLPEHRRQGIATRGLRDVIDLLAARRSRRDLALDSGRDPVVTPAVSRTGNDRGSTIPAEHSATMSPAVRSRAGGPRGSVVLGIAPVR